MSRKSIVLVDLLEPVLCLDCRFAVMADVVRHDGTEARVTFCERRDCDNWDYSSAEPVSNTRVDRELDARL